MRKGDVGGSRNERGKKETNSINSLLGQGGAGGSHTKDNITAHSAQPGLDLNATFSVSLTNGLIYK